MKLKEENSKLAAIKCVEMHVTDQRVTKQTETWTLFKIKSLGNKKHLQLQIAKANPMSEQKLQKKRQRERERETMTSCFTKKLRMSIKENIN